MEFGWKNEKLSKHDFGVLAEQLGDRLAMVRSADSLSNDGRHVHDLKLSVAGSSLFCVGNSVGDHKTF